MRTKTHIALALTVLLASSAAAHSVRQLADLNPSTERTQSSAPFGFAVANGLLFLSANDGVHGAEPWVYDGSPSGMRLLKDIWPGASNSAALPGISFAGRFFFSANDGTHGHEVWMTDGTTAGTQLFADLVPGLASSSPRAYAVQGDELLILGTTADGNSQALWASKATPGSNTLIATFEGRPVLVGTDNFIAFAGGHLFALFRSVPNEPSVTDLWFTDGTPAGTRRLATYRWIEALTTTQHSAIAAVRTEDEDLLVALDDPTGPPRAVASVAGVETLSPFPDGSVVFYGWDNSFGAALWRVDRNDQLEMLVDMRQTTGPFFGDSHMALLQGKYYFATRSPSEERLWATDGTPQGSGPVLSADAIAGAPQDWRNLVATDDALYFDATTDGGGRDLWRTDGTAAGTMLADPAAASPDSSLSDLEVFYERVVLHGQLVYPAYDNAHGIEPRITLPAGGARLLADVNQRHGSFPRSFSTSQGAAFFIASDAAGQAAVWQSDQLASPRYAVAAQTPITHARGRTYPLLRLAAAGQQRVVVTEIGRPAGGQSYTFARAIDGNDNADEPLLQLPFSNLSYSVGLLDDGTAIAPGYDPETGVEPWRIEAGSSSATRIADLAPGTGRSSPASFVRFGNSVYFSARQPATGALLWRSDGTASGTTPVHDLNPDSTRDSPVALQVVDDALYFNAFATFGGPNRSELWRTDGTDVGTVFLSRDIPGVLGVSTQMAGNGATQIVSVATQSEGWGLWRVNPAGDGLTQIVDLDPQGPGNTASWPVALNDRFFFATSRQDVGVELWRSDGTAAGTGLLIDLNQGAAGSTPTDLVVGGDRLFFAADNGRMGQELWTSDGTAFGTRRLTDIGAGAAGGFVDELAVVNDRLLFSADDGISGQEPWVLESVSDLDGDGIANALDNCWLASNADQLDTDNDGLGNVCDADFDQDCAVGVQDLALLRAGFFAGDDRFDLSGDGRVNVIDLGRFRALAQQPPGPGLPVSACHGGWPNQHTQRVLHR